MEVIGTVFAGVGKIGDFKWQILCGDYNDALFIFNDDEMRNKTPHATDGNAIIRQYNKYGCPTRPRSVGIVTGTGHIGYKQFDEETKQSIDACIAEVKEIIKDFAYTKIYYSAKEPGGILGTSIFNVDDDVLDYITKEIHALRDFRD